MPTKKKGSKKVKKAASPKQLSARAKMKATMQEIANNRREGESMTDAVKRHYGK